MNSKQVKAHRRRARQKLKKTKTTLLETPKIILNYTSPSSMSLLLLNKLVSFDYFTLDSTGFILRPLHGIVLKSTSIGNDDDKDDDEIITIRIINNPDHLTTCTIPNKRIESLMMSQQSQKDILTINRSTLLNLNFQLLN